MTSQQIIKKFKSDRREQLQTLGSLQVPTTNRKSPPISVNRNNNILKTL